MRILRAALAVWLVLSAPSVASAQPAALSPYELNAIIPTTGASAFLGKAYVDAIKALELRINSTGGIQGHPLNFVTQAISSNTEKRR